MPRRPPPPPARCTGARGLRPAAARVRPHTGRPRRASSFCPSFGRSPVAVEPSKACEPRRPGARRTAAATLPGAAPAPRAATRPSMPPPGGAAGPQALPAGPAATFAFRAALRLAPRPGRRRGPGPWPAPRARRP
eukprot:7559510-Lingulodinium_polyedra.AAC.1